MAAKKIELKFRPGKNIAMKVPPHEFDNTVAFYRDILGFDEPENADSDNSESRVFKFGDKNLWIDKVKSISQAELWLEVFSNNIEEAKQYLAENHCARRDEIEALPAGFQGFWIASPSNIIHLVTAT